MGASKKHNIKSKQELNLGLKTPENYFANFQTALMNKIQNEKFKEIHQDKLGLNIPDNYFKQSKNEIQQNVLITRNSIFLVASKKRWMAISIAASIALIFMFSMLKNSYVNPSKNVIVSIDNLPIEDNDETILSLFVNDDQIEEHLNENVFNNFDIDDLMSIFIDENDETIASLFVDDNNVNEYLDTCIIEDVLIDN